MTGSNVKYDPYKQHTWGSTVGVYSRENRNNCKAYKRLKTNVGGHKILQSQLSILRHVYIGSNASYFKAAQHCERQRFGA